MVININYKKIFIACMIVGIFLCMSAVGASDFNETTDELTADVDVESVGDDGETIETNDSADAGQDVNVTDRVISTSAKTSSEKVFIKNSKFDIQIRDENKKGIAGKQVQISFNGKVSNYTTDAGGHVYFKLSSKGTYTLTYTFKNEGYATLTGSKTITVVPNSNSKIEGSNYVAYVGVENFYVVKLTTGGVEMIHKKVTFKINGKTYTATTNTIGKAKLNINLPVGTYKIRYSFKGEANANSTSGTSKITVKKGMPTSIVKMNSVTYRHQVKAPVVFKYKDVRGKPIAKQTIVFKINGKTYKGKTDSNGLVTFYIKQNRGIYDAKVSSYNTKVFKKSSNTYSIKVKSKTLKYNGFWLFGRDMLDLDLKEMAKKGVNQIFLNEYAVTLHGKSVVSDFACKAKSLGIKVHIWMSTFYDGKWISPVNSAGTYKYSLFNSIIADAKEYAQIKGVAGIHFDYIRYPGTAYKYKNAADAVSHFTKKACNELHKLNSSLIVSAAVMAEPSAMKYYYGQDIATMSKYLDMIVPMVYKGNYNQNSAWIKSVTEHFVAQSQGAIILTGLQGYYSDSKVKSLPASQLITDADYAGYGGASGVIIFRYTLFNMINFNNL